MGKKYILKAMETTKFLFYNVISTDSSLEVLIVPPFLVYLDPQQIGQCPLMAALLLQSTDPNANVFQKHSHRHN
jgi:hypothetical protein